MIQQQIDFTAVTHTRENNAHSEAILDGCYDKLNNQCKVVYDLLKAGKRLTVRQAMFENGIGDLRARIRDLRNAGLQVKDSLLPGSFKEYFL